MASDSFNIDVFPTLTKQMIQQSKFNLDKVKACDEKGRELIVRGDRHIQFDNETNDWSMDKDGIYLTLSFSIQNIKAFYGRGGVAGPGTILSVAAILKSPISCRRDTFSSEVMISEMDDQVKGDVVVVMNHFDYRDSATLDLVLYVRSGGGCLGFADEQGYVLGIMQSLSLSLNGEGSIFPIDTISSEKNFLWRLECDYSDATVDRFDESIALVFNDKHPLYKNLEIDKINLQNPLLLSILSHAIQLLIEKVTSELTTDQLFNGNGISEGSVGAAVRFFVINFAHSRDDPTELAYEIQQYLLPGIGNGSKVENIDRQ